MGQDKKLLQDRLEPVIMNISHFFKLDNKLINFTRPQASSFAKSVAGDFNPIHDEDNKRFCVPGDLLFSVFLSQQGVYQEMKFEFSGMVGDSNQVFFSSEGNSAFVLKDENDKNFMRIQTSGEMTQEPEFINQLSEKYVQYSGQTFPHILVPLMQQEGVMINPARPLVIYKNMEITLDRLSGKNIELRLTKSILNKNGKKGEARLEFAILADGEEIGHGAKNLLLSGLREYDQSSLDEVIDAYDQRKTTYLNR